MVNNSSNTKTSLTILIESFRNVNPNYLELKHQSYTSFLLHFSSLEHHISFHSTDTYESLTSRDGSHIQISSKLTCRGEPISPYVRFSITNILSSLDHPYIIISTNIQHKQVSCFRHENCYKLIRLKTILPDFQS